MVTNHRVVLGAQWGAAPPLIAQKAAAAEPSIRHRRWRLRAPSAHLGAAGAGRRQQALDAPTSPPAASQGRYTVLHQPRSARTAAAKQLRTSHRGAAALLSAAAAAGQPGPRRAPRPVSPGTAALAADARGARRAADTLNELRPLRQRVSRAAGVCLPAAAGCQRSSARRCRLSAARCRRPGRRSSSPTTHHLRT